VPEANTRGDASSDDELTAMRCPVMHTAKRDQVVGLVSATLGTRLDVMKVQKPCVAATWDDTSLVIAAQHGSAPRGCDGLLRTSARVGAFDRDGAATGRADVCLPRRQFHLPDIKKR
jgi:hypothetical protein